MVSRLARSNSHMSLLTSLHRHKETVCTHSYIGLYILPSSFSLGTKRFMKTRCRRPGSLEGGEGEGEKGSKRIEKDRKNLRRGGKGRGGKRGEERGGGRSNGEVVQRSQDHYHGSRTTRHDSICRPFFFVTLFCLQ